MKRPVRKAIRVLIVDDHPVVRRGLQSCLADRPEFQLVGEAADGEEALRLASALHPDLILVDINMPRMDGLQLCEALQTTAPNVRVVILSIHNKPDSIERAVRAGAKGYLLKDTSPHQLIDALLKIHQGQMVFSPQVTQATLEHWISRPRRPAGRPGLSRREKEVLAFIARGLSNRQIAQQLGLSPRTVETHRERIMRKLDLHTVAGLTRYAIAQGLVPLQDETAS
jgi:two-component system nitrate/nitrite response regulator NarL